MPLLAAAASASSVSTQSAAAASTSIGGSRCGASSVSRVARDEPGVHAAGGEIRMRHDATEQIEVAGDADHVGSSQRTTQCPQRLVARGAAADQLGEHRVVVDGNRIAGCEAGIDADVR